MWQISRAQVSYDLRPMLKLFVHILKGAFFRINNTASTMMPIDTEREIVQAFKAWEEVTELKFHEEYDPSAIIQISFVTGDHNDGHKFYENTLVHAHAFFPNPNKTLAGDIHFNDDIEFTSRRHLVDDSDGKKFNFWHFSKSCKNLIKFPDVL
jgi:hypothetical protein